MKFAICSKGRYNNVITLKHLKDFKKEDIYLFVEPQEMEKYIMTCGHLAMIVKIPENDRGVGYARHCALDHLRGEVVCMMDDDTEQFYIIQNKKGVKFNDFGAIIAFLMKKIPEYALVAVSPYPFASWEIEDDSFNVITGAFMLIDTKQIGRINFKEELMYNEDKWFLIELVEAGKKIMVEPQFYLRAKPVPKTGGGGIHTFSNYQFIKSMEEMRALRPNYFSWFVDKKGNQKLKIKWREIKKNYDKHSDTNLQ